MLDGISMKDYIRTLVTHLFGQFLFQFFAFNNTVFDNYTVSLLVRFVHTLSQEGIRIDLALLLPQLFKGSHDHRISSSEPRFGSPAQPSVTQEQRCSSDKYYPFPGSVGLITRGLNYILAAQHSLGGSQGLTQIQLLIINIIRSEYFSELIQPHFFSQKRYRPL